MRLGTLRGTTHLPQGSPANTDVSEVDGIVRYLGIFLGAPQNVARKWHERITSKMQTRCLTWASRSVPATRDRCNIVIKNSIFALALVHGLDPKLIYSQ